MVTAVTVSYAYQFQAVTPASLRGMEQLVAKISNGQGITRTIPIQSAATAFTGERFIVSGTLDMAALNSAASAFVHGCDFSVGGRTRPVGACAAQRLIQLTCQLQLQRG